MKILIVDDNPAHTVEIEMKLDSCGYHNTTIASNLTDARVQLDNEHIDVVILDMNLESESGVDLCEELNRKLIPFIVITSYKDEKYYKESISASPEAYLIKPIEKLTLKNIIDKIALGFDENQVKDSIDGVFIKNKNQFHKIIFKDLCYVKAEGNYCTIFTSQKRLTIRSTIKDLESKMKTKSIRRVHRSYLVNIDFISSIDFAKGEISFLENTKIPIGKNYRKALKEYIQS